MNPQTQVLLVSAGVIHPPFTGRLQLRRALAALDDFRFEPITSLEELPRLDLDQYQGMVHYFHHDSISTEALAALDEFVNQGGGLLAVHSASASFKESEHYYAILGGRFTHHGPVQSFSVQPSASEDEVFGRYGPFSVVDELYRHAYDEDNQVHFYTVVDGEREPVVWTRAYGSGRVCYCSLGHRAESLRHPAVQAILQKGLIWACGAASP